MPPDAPTIAGEPDHPTCEVPDCGKLAECFVCETCAAHCALEDPEDCWRFHEAWRTGQPDPAFVTVIDAVPPPAPGQVRRINGQEIPQARRPRRVQ